MQSRGNGVKRAPQSTIPEAAKTLKGGDLGFGSVLFLGKNLPSPRFKMNMFMDYDIGTGKINYPDDIKAALEKLNSLLQGIQPNMLDSNSELETTNDTDMTDNANSEFDVDTTYLDL